MAPVYPGSPNACLALFLSVSLSLSVFLSLVSVRRRACLSLVSVRRRACLPDSACEVGPVLSISFAVAGRILGLPITVSEDEEEAQANPVEALSDSELVTPID